MAACAPQRFLANNRNAILEAALTPSSVLAVEESVLAIPTARGGTAQVAITGAYTGEEAATYDFEILDDDVETPLISAPVFTGEGSGALEDIAADLPAQEILLELSESGLPLLAAKIDLEGVTVKARAAGASGNAIYIRIDQSGLTFTPQAYSLLNDLEAGEGGEDSPLTGAEYDFDTKVLGADNAIPVDAHRISFGSDPNIYLQYKRYADGEWDYHFVPALKRAVPRGTIINFVTGGRTVEVYPGSPPETYTGIVTLYDLLDKFRTESALVDVEGVIANDRSPTGQAAHELQTRTDAYFHPSTGEGSAAATGFVDVSVATDAGTQLVTATCRAVTAADHPLAGVGRERWELRSSILGDLGTIVTGEVFDGDEFALKIPRVLPYGIATQTGTFTVTDIEYVARGEGERDPPPICPGVGERAGLLGPDAIDQILTLTYTKRPSGACLCDDMPVPDLSGECLGIFDEEGGADMAYSADAVDRLKALYDWAAALITAVTQYKSGYAMDGVPEAVGTAINVLGGGGSYTMTPADALSGSRTYAGPNSTLTTTFNATITTHGDNDDLLLDVVPVETGYADVAMPPDFQACIDFYETGIAEIDAVTDGTLKAAGFAQWDLALAEFQSDLAASPELSSLGNRLASIAVGKYRVLVKQAMAYAGIPQLGKSDASSIVSGDGCWQDYGDPFYWGIVGSSGGAYAPAFSNHPYYSSRRADDQNAYYSTHEFAFQLNIKCPQDLREGDVITMAIGNAARPSTYQVDDVLTLPIIAANDLYLAGGQDSSLVQSWYVTGSVTGALPPYAFDPDSPVPYSYGSPESLTFLLVPGGIDFVNGDQFKFSIEGGHYQWRKNGGAWNVDSPPLPIPSGTVAFDDGLSVTFTPGAAPSFVAGDRFSFRALQPWAVSNLRTPTVERWQFADESPGQTLDIDLGSVQSLDMLAIALHTLPAGTTLSLAGGVAAPVDWTETPVWREGVIALPFTATRSARYLRLSLTNANGGGIGWLWIGEAFTTTRGADVTPHRAYRFARGDGGNNPSARFLGKGRGADVAWNEAALTDADMTGLGALLDWVKENDDEWLIFLAQVTRPAEAMLVQVTDDQIDEHDLGEGNRNADVDRLFDVRLSFGAVLT